jgi:hypothetical protein
MLIIGKLASLFLFLFYFYDRLFCNYISFYRFAGNLSLEQLLPIPYGYTTTEFQQQARISLRSLCRIYLTDFLCLNYSLPKDCDDMKNELEIAFQDYEALIYRNPYSSSLGEATATETKIIKENDMISIYDHLRDLFPKSWMRWLAYFHCFFEISPECEIQIIHGKLDEDILEKHDEL